MSAVEKVLAEVAALVGRHVGRYEYDVNLATGLPRPACMCGWVAASERSGVEVHAAHVATALAPVLADVWDEGDVSSGLTDDEQEDLDEEFGDAFTVAWLDAINDIVVKRARLARELGRVEALRDAASDYAERSTSRDDGSYHDSTAPDWLRARINRPGGAS